MHELRRPVQILTLDCVVGDNRSSHWFWSGLETLLLGGACATVAFTIGYYVNGMIGEEGDSLP